ncbi:uncharacterized protein LOC135493439 [Lineus longissimus]|uniref:uncharacterized protein LOC135493439 n=1 Tax=Lineus longissimus TaxID=88925 RepID=UPI00315CF4D5
MNSGQNFVTKDDHQLLAVQLVPNNSLHSVSVEGKWFEYDTGSRVLHQSSAQTLLLPCSAASARILCCENVVNAVTGETVPYVIVAAKSGEPEDPDYSITLFVLGAKKKLYIAAQTFFVPSFCTFEYGTDVLTVLQSSVRILDGPTVLFLSENNGCFHFIYRICNVGSSHSVTSELNHYTGKIKYSELPPSKNEDSNDKSYNYHRFLSADVKFSHWHRTTILTVHSIGTTKPTQKKNVPFSLVQSTIKITDWGQNVEHGTALSDLIPDVYASICTSEVLSIQNSRCHSFLHEDVHNDAEGPAAKDTVICTKFGQMAQFCYNHLYSCEEIPAKDIQRIFIVDAFDNEYVAAVSQENGVIAVKLEDLKLCGHWPSAKYVVVGDFLQNGTDQLLLLPASWWRESETISSFCLTDFGFCCVDTLDDAEAMGEPMEDGDSNNLGTIVEHLESRVQCGMTALHHSENLCREKMDLAKKTSQGLCSMAIEGSSMLDHNHNNPSNMVDLFSDRANHVAATSSLREDFNHQPQPFDVAETWQRIVGNKWIIGVDVINRTGRDISEICLLLVQDSPDLPNLKCHSKVQNSVRANDNKQGAEPHSKRRKVVPSNGQPYSITAPEEEDMVTLTTVTDLPKFTFPTISCQLLLQWSFSGLAGGGPQNGGGDACQPHAARPSQWVCGQISLQAEHVVSEKFNVKLTTAPQEVCEVRRILQCLNTCQLETTLQLQSSFLTNDALISALQRFGLTFHKMYHSYIDLELGMFHLLRVDLETKGQGQGLWITVHSNDENQLMMFIHMLYSGLPDDLNIVHGKRGNMAAAMATALNHMVQEVNQSCHSISNALKSTGHADAMEFDQVSLDQTVADLRQNFELKKRKFMEDDVKPSASQPVLRFPHLQSLTDGSVSNMVKESESL